MMLWVDPSSILQEQLLGMAWQHGLLLPLPRLMSKGSQASPLLCPGTFSPAGTSVTYLLLHHPRSKDLLDDVGIILGRLLGTVGREQFSWSLAPSQHGVAACPLPAHQPRKEEGIWELLH